MEGCTDDRTTMKPNHLLGYKRLFLQLNFTNVTDLLAVRKAIMPVAERNKKKMDAMDTYAEVARCVDPSPRNQAALTDMQRQCWV